MVTVDSPALCPALVTEILEGNALPLLRTDELDWVPLKPLCEGLGLNWAGERSRLKHDPKLTCRFLPMDGSDGRAREFLCLPLYQLSGWLLSVNADRVSENVRETVRAFQKESLEALFGYWHGARGGAESQEIPGESDKKTDRGAVDITTDGADVQGDQNPSFDEPPVVAEAGDEAETLESRVTSVIEQVLGTLGRNGSVS
ncbi:phage antirepressor N-terminal domain-containing protein [Desulfoluna spongiiphila]|uniref:phage antirepressor N-terminal domain-containing protein n=1 Tax=Desulfoluna spongiiphila TaxID=419481 RepID=UPI00125C942E|nr:phage antirepressor N-terminal domain-containing protein [Desulfoluna spongiiphila]VVS93749.1 consensus disorder prediction [Desulfoluna spongiiphila]